MVSETVSWLSFACALAVLPFLSIGFIRKAKAHLQNRYGAPILQPLFNVLKLLRKDETISADTTWIFRSSAAINAGTALVLACLLPWVPFKPPLPGDDIFLVIYLFASIRFFTVLAALDTGSPFGAFGAGREVLLALLVEPAVVLSFTALGVSVRSTSLSTIFSFAPSSHAMFAPIWILTGLALFLCSLVELSRMPIDDPTTHLELTMVHEAMTIESSGPNLALTEITYALRLVMLYGLSAQCFLHALTTVFQLSQLMLAILSVVLIFALALATALIETLGVKLQWRKNPEFIAYSLTMALLASLAALVGAALK